MTMDEIDLHLGWPILVDQSVDLDVLVLAKLINIVEQRIEFIDGSDAV